MSADPRPALVIGLAETGVAVARVLRAEGRRVIVIEDSPQNQPGSSTAARYLDRAAAVRAVGAELVEAPTAAEVRELVGSVDLVVPSPLVRPDHPAIEAARARSVAVRSEIDLAGERAHVPIVAVTGTNGKTTVTTMIAAMLEASGVPTVAAGNIGRPLIDAVGDAVFAGGDSAVIVAEVSSFQLAFTHEAFRPRVAVLLAITPDHLDWHGSLTDYAQAKAKIAAHQTGADLLVYDADDPTVSEIAAHAPAPRVGVSARADATGCFRVVDEQLVFPDGHVLAPVAVMARALAHDRTNALTAAAAALAVGATVEGVVVALGTYATMPHRVALVGEASGVEWYDDSKATNPDATRRAVASFDSVVLLAGGRNKGLDLSVLAAEVSRLRGVVAFGEAGPEIEAAFAGTGVAVETAADMHAAVQAARRIARPGDTVLLSPACASFDAYAGYAARGDDFAREVRAQVMQEATFAMTAVSPRVPLERIRSIGNPFARLGRSVVARLEQREQLARPPAYMVLCATVTVLNVVGLVMILSASSVAALSDYGSSWYFFNRQLIWAVVGLGAFLLSSRIDYRKWRRFAPVLLGFALLVLTFVLVAGKLVSGSQRWIVLGPLQLQPSEIAKLALLVCGAEILTKRADRLDDPRAWRPVVAIFVVFAVLVMKEPDLASTIVLGVILGSLLIVGGVRARHLAQMIGIGVAGAGVLSLLAGYRRARIFSFLHPGHDVGNTGYQLWRSLIAIGSGGVNGVGLGAGRAKWFFLPNAHTDFIFAIIGEELGFIGCLLVLGLFVGLGLVGLRIARRAPDRFGMLIATGVTAWIVGQAAINLGAVVGLLPVSGVPLPFLSVGGTSLVITMFGVGVVANIARQTAPSPPRTRARTPKRPVRVKAS